MYSASGINTFNVYSEQAKSDFFNLCTFWISGFTQVLLLLSQNDNLIIVIGTHNSHKYIVAQYSHTYHLANHYL